MNIMRIDPDNMRVILLNGHKFFKFKKPETFPEKQWLYFEAQRYCYLHESNAHLSTDKILEMSKKPFSYWTDENDNLFYHPLDKKFIGKFVTNKTCNKVRFLNILNIKSGYWCGV